MKDVTLELTEKEAFTLSQVLSCVGGHIYHSDRSLIENIIRQLERKNIFMDLIYIDTFIKGGISIESN
jgi:hypothetical protein